MFRGALKANAFPRAARTPQEPRRAVRPIGTTVGFRWEVPRSTQNVRKVNSPAFRGQEFVLHRAERKSCFLKTFPTGVRRPSPPPPAAAEPRRRAKHVEIFENLKKIENFRIFQKVSKWSEMVRKVSKSCYFGVFERFSVVFRCFGVGALYSPCGSRHL